MFLEHLECSYQPHIQGRGVLGVLGESRVRLFLVSGHPQRAFTKCMPSGLLYTATISVFAATRLASRPLLAGPALRQSRGCRLMASVSGVIYAQAHLAASHAQHTRHDHTPRVVGGRARRAPLHQGGLHPLR